MRLERSGGPAVRAGGSFGNGGQAGGGRRNRLIEGNRDVGSERLLNFYRKLGREAVVGTVEMALEGDAVIVDLAQLAERDDLEPTGVGEDRPIPGHEAVQAAQGLDAFVARTQIQVVRVR